MKKTGILIAVILSVVSCRFKNDLDYPIVKGNILDLRVEGQIDLKIDPSTREAVVYLDETADMGSLPLFPSSTVKKRPLSNPFHPFWTSAPPSQ